MGGRGSKVPKSPTGWSAPHNAVVHSYSFFGPFLCESPKVRGQRGVSGFLTGSSGPEVQVHRGSTSRAEAFAPVEQKQPASNTALFSNLKWVVQKDNNRLRISFPKTTSKLHINKANWGSCAYKFTMEWELRANQFSSKFLCLLPWSFHFLSSSPCTPLSTI